MNPPPHERGGRSRYGPGPAPQQAGQQQQQQYPFVVDPTEAAGAAAVRAFFPAPGAGEPPSSSSSAAARAPLPTAMQQGHRYGGGAPEISLAHGAHGHHGIHHRYHQFGVEGRQDGGPSSLPPHSSSPPGFFSSPVVDNGIASTSKLARTVYMHGNILVSPEEEEETKVLFGSRIVT